MTTNVNDNFVYNASGFEFTPIALQNCSDRNRSVSQPAFMPPPTETAVSSVLSQVTESASSVSPPGNSFNRASDDSTDSCIALYENLFLQREFFPIPSKSSTGSPSTSEEASKMTPTWDGVDREAGVDEATSSLEITCDKAEAVVRSFLQKGSLEDVAGTTESNKICAKLETALKNTSTSISDVASLMNKLASSGDAKEFFKTPRFLEIGSLITKFITANQAKVAKLDFKDFSNIIAAFDKLGYRNEGLFVEVFGNAIIHTKRTDFYTINFQNIADILHAFASMNILNEGVFTKLSTVILSKLKSKDFLEKQMVQQASFSSITTILWSYACYKSSSDDRCQEAVASLIDRYKSKVLVACNEDKIRLIQAKMAYDLPVESKDIDFYRREKEKIEAPSQNRNEIIIQHLANTLGMEFKRGTLLNSSHHIPDLLDLTKKVVIEFDGPAHFIKNGDGTNHINGSTQLRDFMIRTKDKVQVVSIPWFEWASLGEDSEKIDYLQGRIIKK